MEEPRLRPKYAVQRQDENRALVGPRMLSTDPDDIDSPFVLMPRKDPAAFEAMRLYIQLCEPLLATEIRTWLRKIADSATVYGTQGERNRRSIRRMSLIAIE